jgi:hypothetical protein
MNTELFNYYHDGNRKLVAVVFKRGTIRAIMDSDFYVHWTACHDGRREYYPACSRADVVAAAERDFGIGMDVVESPLTPAAAKEA